MSIDPRLAERRKAVAEDKAVRNVGRLLRFLVVMMVLGVIAWTAFSPWLSVSQVRTAGVAVSDANSILASHRVVAGTPMIMLRPDGVETALRGDPWIRDARVHLDWPDQVVVQVIEREPVAWYQTFEGWALRDLYGVALPVSGEPDPEQAWVLLPDVSGREATEDPLVLGTAEFVAALPASLHPGTRIRVENGEIWATVDGYEARLGRPTEMEAKALSLLALLGEGIEPGSILVLVAPTHPAVIPPSSEQPDSTGDDGATSEETGDSQDAGQP